MKDMILAKKAELKKRGYKGFTLMEMLIVVAIIAVLVAIAIPVFTTQLEKAREATDAANIRSAYAEAMAESLAGNGTNAVTKEVTLRQSTEGWQNKFDFPANLTEGSTEPKNGGKATLTYTPGAGTCTIDIKLTQKSS